MYFIDACMYMSSSVKDNLGSADHSPVTSAIKSPYLPLTPDTLASSGFISPLSASNAQQQHSVSSLPSVSVTGTVSASVGDSSPSHSVGRDRRHTRHRSVDFALAEIVPDLSETIDTDFLHAARYDSYTITTTAAAAAAADPIASDFVKALTSTFVNFSFAYENVQ